MKFQTYQYLTKRYLQVFILFFVGLFLFESIAHCNAQPEVGASQAGAPQKAGIALPDQPMPKLTEDDLDSMIKMLETMDDETLDALAKIGEEFIKEAESQGKDPFELLGFPVEPENGKEPETGSPEVAVAPEIPETQPIKEIKVPKVDTHQVREARTMLKNITDKIAAIRVKAEAERAAADKLVPLKYLLDDLVYYLHTLSQEKLLKYLTDKEFEKLYKALVELENDLNYLEPLFVLPEATLEGVNPYTMLGIPHGASWATVNEAYQNLSLEKDPRTIKQKLKKEGKAGEELEKALQKARTEYEEYTEAYSTILAREQAYQALERIIDSLIRAAYTHNIITEAKKLLERYEPEAVKIKSEQEALEKKARKEQEEALRRRPPFAPPVFEPMPFYGDPTLPGEDTYITPTPEQYIPTDTTSIPGITPSGPGVPDARKPGVPDKSKKEEVDKKKPGKPDEAKAKGRSAKVNKKLESIEKELESLTNFIDSGPETGGKSAEVIFKGFVDYIGRPIAKPYDASNPEIVKAKEINGALPEITKRLNIIKKEVRSPILNKEERSQLKQEAKKLWDQYKEKQLKKISGLFTPALRAKASSEKIYLHFGGDESTLEDIVGTGRGNEKQEDKTKRIEFIEKVGGSNLLVNFLEAHQNLLKEFK